MKKTLYLSLWILSLLIVSSCGKISSPEPMPNSGYPHTYPYR